MATRVQNKGVMEKFIKLTVIGKCGDKAERVFNLRYVKAFMPSTNSILLFGNKKPFLVTSESMYRLCCETIQNNENS